MNPFDVSKKVEKKYKEATYQPETPTKGKFFSKKKKNLFRLSSILYIGIVCVNLWFVWPLFKREREREREVESG